MTPSGKQAILAALRAVFEALDKLDAAIIHDNAFEVRSGLKSDLVELFTVLNTDPECAVREALEMVRRHAP